jgi:hypothetical protein
MEAAMDKEERRSEPRARFSGEGFFIQDSTLWELKFLDGTSDGVGAFCNREFKPGVQGVLSVRLPSSDELENILSEVRWCILDPGAKDPFYSYRIGLRFLD